MKKLKLLTYIIMVISAVLVGVFLFGGETKGAVGEARINLSLIWAYILLGSAVVLALVFTVFNTVSNPKSLKKMAINIGFFVVVFGVSYLLASSAHTSVTPTLPNPPSAAAMKLTDTGLKAVYFLFAGSLLAIIFGAVLAAIRNR
ncbi:MAG: hypothetical protein FWE30_05545 [Bacteroidales bacterium]|nr:hypothetical protein [Bacteroidales bacterium]MCL2738892.1 hypothetical protein [Bacteroidales bacterium]